MYNVISDLFEVISIESVNEIKEIDARKDIPLSYSLAIKFFLEGKEASANEYYLAFSYRWMMLLLSDKIVEKDIEDILAALSGCPIETSSIRFPEWITIHSSDDSADKIKIILKRISEEKKKFSEAKYQLKEKAEFLGSIVKEKENQKALIVWLKSIVINSIYHNKGGALENNQKLIKEYTESAEHKIGQHELQQISNALYACVCRLYVHLEKDELRWLKNVNSEKYSICKINMIVQASPEANVYLLFSEPQGPNAEQIQTQDEPIEEENKVGANAINETIEMLMGEIKILAKSLLNTEQEENIEEVNKLIKRVKARADLPEVVELEINSIWKQLKTQQSESIRKRESSKIMKKAEAKTNASVEKRKLQSQRVEIENFCIRCHIKKKVVVHFEQCLESCTINYCIPCLYKELLKSIS